MAEVMLPYKVRDGKGGYLKSVHGNLIMRCVK
jgi:hypothetical protein